MTIHININGNLPPEVVIVRFGLRTQHSWVTEEPIRCLWPETTRLNKSQITANAATDGHQG